MTKLKTIALCAFAIITLHASRSEAQTNSATHDEGVVINGVRWATRNVGAPGTFVDNPTDTGMHFQWNRRKGWSDASELSDWDSTYSTSTAWEGNNDPCPPGWRLPTREELFSLRDAGSVWTAVDGVEGRLFFGSASNQLFLPIAGLRSHNTGALHDTAYWGYYWSATPCDPSRAWLIWFSHVNIVVGSNYRHFGVSVRCVEKTDSIFPDMLREPEIIEMRPIQPIQSAQEVRQDGGLVIHIGGLDARSFQNTTAHPIAGVSAPFINGGFELLLPPTIDRNLVELRPITEEWAEILEASFEISNKDALGYFIDYILVKQGDIDFAALVRAGEMTTYLPESDYADFGIQALIFQYQALAFQYVDSDVTITGVSTEYSDGFEITHFVDLDFRRGWNIVYVTVIGNELEYRISSHITTHDIEAVNVELKWECYIASQWGLLPEWFEDDTDFETEPIEMTPPPTDHPMIGEWVWDTDALFQYIFHADGTGIRGFLGAQETFRWAVPEADNLIIRLNNAPILFGVRYEEWRYSIVDNVLILDSRQAFGMRFEYIRVESSLQSSTLR